MMSEKYPAPVPYSASQLPQFLCSILLAAPRMARRSHFMSGDLRIKCEGLSVMEESLSAGLFLPAT